MQRRKGRVIDIGDEAKEREGGQGRGKVRQSDDKRGWLEMLGGVDDNSTCLDCISQQPWGLMMEVIGT